MREMITQCWCCLNHKEYEKNVNNWRQRHRLRLKMFDHHCQKSCQSGPGSWHEIMRDRCFIMLIQTSPYHDTNEWATCTTCVSYYSKWYMYGTWEHLCGWDEWVNDVTVVLCAQSLSQLLASLVARHEHLL